MSNLTVFSHEHLSRLLEPFAPGMYAHITPIKYEALTPDRFLLLFRTTGINSDDHYFVSLETDFEANLDTAKQTVEDWHGSKVIEFWPPQDKQKAAESGDIKYFKVATDGPYFALLAKVERPVGKGYWAQSIKILPGDNIAEKIKHFSGSEQANIRKVLSRILRPTYEATMSLIESLKAKTQATPLGDINDTDMAVSLYVQSDGKVECFFNRVSLAKGKNRPTAKDRGKGKVQ